MFDESHPSGSTLPPPAPPGARAVHASRSCLKRGQRSTRTLGAASIVFGALLLVGLAAMGAAATGAGVALCCGLGTRPGVTEGDLRARVRWDWALLVLGLLLLGVDICER